MYSRNSQCLTYSGVLRSRICPAYFPRVTRLISASSKLNKARTQARSFSSRYVITLTPGYVLPLIVGGEQVSEHRSSVSAKRLTCPWSNLHPFADKTKRPFVYHGHVSSPIYTDRHGVSTESPVTYGGGVVDPMGWGWNE